MASFTIDLWRIGMLAFGTIQGYVWAVCEAHQQSGFSSPLDNVQDWKMWMASLEVQAYSPGEPHKMIEFDLFMQALGKVNLHDRFEVACANIYLCCYFTHARSEYPVPKARSGDQQFDPEHNTRKCDYRTCNGYAEWGIGATKADPRNKRAASEPDKRQWKPVGNANGIISMIMWMNRYFALCDESCWPDGPQSPMFVGNDGRYITYQQCLDFMRTLLMRVPGMTRERAFSYGMHSLRVLGYNCHKALNGVDVAALHGSWASSAHYAYGRETLNQILSFAQEGAMLATQLAMPPMPLDACVRRDVAHVPVPSPPQPFALPALYTVEEDTAPSALSAAAQAMAALSASTATAVAQDDITFEQRTTPKGKNYKIYFRRGFAGKFPSRKAAERAVLPG